MNIQYNHKRKYKAHVFNFEDFKGVKYELEAKGGTTIALQVPTLEQFDSFEIKPLDHWGFYPSVELEFGMAKCSDEDNYNKKLGAKIATGRMQSVVFFVRKDSLDRAILSDAQGKLPELKLVKHGDKIFFVEAGKF